MEEIKKELAALRSEMKSFIQKMQLKIDELGRERDEARKELSYKQQTVTLAEDTIKQQLARIERLEQKLQKIVSIGSAPSGSTHRPEFAVLCRRNLPESRHDHDTITT